MAEQYFRVTGVNIDNLTWDLAGSGVPGAAGGLPDEAPVGSTYRDASTGIFYSKVTAGAGAGNWRALANRSDVDAEEGYLRSFIGKGAAGAEMPAYSSTNYVADGDALESAIGKLDLQAGTSASDVGALAAELNTTQSGAGLNPDGTYAPALGSNYLAGATSLMDADLLLDAQVKSNSDAIAGLQGQLQSSLQVRSAAGVTTETVLDTVALTSVAVAKWIVHAYEEATPANRIALEVLALHNGVDTAGHTQYGLATFGSAIAGLLFDVDVATGAMRLKVSSTAAVTVKATRLEVAA